MANPLGHEYSRNHRAFRILAEKLAYKGFTVLRFDFLGTGDSWGDLEDIALTDWVEDLHLAREALAAEIGDGPVCLIGRRLGASLALLADAEKESGPAGAARTGLGLDRAVLWNPVLEGEPFLREIEGVHREYYGAQAHRGNVAAEEDEARNAHEILGMEMPPALAAQIEGLNVHQAYAARGEGTLILDSHPSGNLLQEPPGATLRRVEDPWLAEEPLRVFVPMHLLQMITQWIAEG